MKKEFLSNLAQELESLKEAGLFKAERIITSPQQAEVIANQQSLLNFCANNYLGLSNHQRVKEAAQTALERYGFGMSSVRFICGTLDVHKELEESLSEFLGTEDTILYSSCFDANTGLFETLLGPDDAVISDSLTTPASLMVLDSVRQSAIVT